MSQRIVTLLGWVVLGAGLALGQESDEKKVEDLPRPEELSPAATPARLLTPLPPIPAESPVLEPVPTAPELPKLKPRPGFSLKAEYLVWWVRDGGLDAPLVTTGPASSAGVLGLPGTLVAYGPADFDLDHYSGFRWTGTFWCDAEESCGWQISGFVLEHGAEFFYARSDASGLPLLSRPIIDASTGGETVALVAYPDAFTGAVATSLRNQFWGLETNLTGKLESNQFLSCYWIGGVRYLRFDERFNAQQRSTLLADGIAGFEGDLLFSGDGLYIEDQFSARSQFYGGQIGASADMKLGPAVLSSTFKLAMGCSREVLNVNGMTVLLRPGVDPRIAAGGLYALASNGGRHESTVFAVVPEFGLNLGVAPMRNLRATLGYNFLYWSSVLRAGDQINRVINPTQVPSSLRYGPLLGPAQPQLPFDQTDFWAQGLNFSLELRF